MKLPEVVKIPKGNFPKGNFKVNSSMMQESDNNLNKSTQDLKQVLQGCGDMK
jgi:hypothetical protein